MEEGNKKDRGGNKSRRNLGEEEIKKWTQEGKGGRKENEEGLKVKSSG